jgi:hypothetical protein
MRRKSVTTKYAIARDLEPQQVKTETKQVNSMLA